MNFWENIKNIRNQIKEVEESVYSGKSSFVEVYERNLKLEAEIAARTKELDVANKQMLTIQHIWEMMNSSKPLSSVLNAVVNNLQGELGYLHSCFVELLRDEQGAYYRIVAHSGQLFGDNFTNFFKCEPSDLRLSPSRFQNLIPNKIYQSQDIMTLITNVLPDVDREYISKSLSVTKTKSYIFVPIMREKKHFGTLVVFSSREEATPIELNFLSLFSRQIEMAVTIAELFQTVKEQAVTDAMTGLYNRRYFEEFINKESVRSDRQRTQFTVIGLDLDHLKKINDVYGHNYGDIAIKSIATALKKCCRSIDVAARMGGEEFNVILPGVDSEDGMRVAERIRQEIEKIELEKVGRVTASLGVATYKEHSDNVEELLELVDHAMYESKRNGRNRVTAAQKSEEISWQNVAIDTFIEILSKHKIPIDIKTSKLLNQKLTEMNINNESLFQVSDTLISIYNPDHQKDVTKKKILFASLLAKRFDLSRDAMDKLKIAILLYDIGNIMLPKELLSKKEPLSKTELASIKKHPIIAAREILEPISDVVDVLPIIEKHHENWNGTGYPNKLSGTNIPIESQIILIVDSYFALLENRPYRQAKSKEEAIHMIIKDSNRKWSAKLADEFVSIIKEDVE